MDVKWYILNDTLAQAPVGGELTLRVERLKEIGTGCLSPAERLQIRRGNDWHYGGWLGGRHFAGGLTASAAAARAAAETAAGHLLDAALAHADWRAEAAAELQAAFA